jgi:hypothetical protein
MSEKYKFRDHLGAYFVTLTTVGWVDIYKARSQTSGGAVAQVLPKRERPSDPRLVSHDKSSSHGD